MGLKYKKGGGRIWELFRFLNTTLAITLNHNKYLEKEIIWIQRILKM